MTDDLCLDVSTQHGPIKMLKCHKMGGNQKWLYSKEVCDVAAGNAAAAASAPSMRF